MAAASRAAGALPRVGVLVASSDTCVEVELPALLAGVATCHFARMRLESVTEQGLRAMEERAVAAARDLGDASPDLLAFACTSGTFILGAEHESTLATRLSRAAGCPVVTTARALVTAIRECGDAQGIAQPTVRLRTAYDAPLTAAEARYLAGFGIATVSSLGLGLTVDEEIARVAPDRLVEFVRGRADEPVVPTCCVLSCTSLRTRRIARELETAAGVHVVTSNGALARAIALAIAG